MGHGLKLQGHLGQPFGQPLARADVDGHPGPAPVVDGELEGHVGLGLAGRAHALLLAVAGDGVALDPAAVVLGPYGDVGDVGELGHHHRAQGLHLLVTDALSVYGPRRLHEGEREHLHDVVLHDVAQSPGRLVEAAPLFDADGLGHSDLDVVDVIARPQGLEDGVGEAQGEYVLDRLLTEVVVDAVYLVLGEDLVQGRVEFARCVAVTAEGLFDHQAGRASRFGLIEAHLAQRFGHPGENLRDGGQVEGAVGPRTQRLLDLLQPGLQGGEGIGVGVLPGNVGTVFHDLGPARPGVGDGAHHEVTEAVVRHLRAGHAHHGERRRQ